MEIVLGSIVIFVAAAALLVLGQWLRRAPMPVGCTPVNGRCCRDPDGCSARREAPGALHADP